MNNGCRRHHDQYTRGVHPPPYQYSRVVTAPLCHVHNDLLDGLVVVAGVDAVSGAPHLGRIKLAGVDVNSNDARRTSTLMIWGGGAGQDRAGQQGEGGGDDLGDNVW